jgi:hypothetical protein
MMVQAPAWTILLKMTDTTPFTGSSDLTWSIALARCIRALAKLGSTTEAERDFDH